MLVLRGVEDQKAFDKGLNNSTTARGLMVLFDRQDMDARSMRSPMPMIDVLKRQKFNDAIPAGLPAGPSRSRSPTRPAASPVSTTMPPSSTRSGRMSS